MPALLLPFLLALASATSLNTTSHFKLATTFHVPRLVNKCAQKGETILGVSRTHQCPCHARFAFERFDNHHVQVDFLVVRHEQAQVVRSGASQFDYEPELSTLAATVEKNGRYDGGTFSIEKEGNYALVLRVRQNVDDCDTQVSFTLETKRSQCPIVLPTQIEDRRHAVTPRIVGGNVPHKSLRTHMVAFLVGNSFVCSGSVIGPRWVMTAAHCPISTQYRASIGGERVVGGIQIPVDRVFRHPNYDRGREDSPYDIMLVRLRDPVPSNTNYIRVNTNTTVPVPGAYARAMGYGQTEQKQTNPRLLQVDVPVVAMPECRNDYAAANPPVASGLRDELQLCAGLDEGGCDACQGDSGGPLAIFDDNGNMVQIGIVSFGIGCARARFPGVYTRVSFFESWMISIGAEFIRSSDGKAQFSDGSGTSSKGSGFSIAGLTTTQTILVLAAAGVSAIAVATLLAYPFMRRRRRNTQQIRSADSVTVPPAVMEGRPSYPPSPPGYGGMEDRQDPSTVEAVPTYGFAEGPYGGDGPSFEEYVYASEYSSTTGTADVEEGRQTAGGSGAGRDNGNDGESPGEGSGLYPASSKTRMDQ